MLWHKNPTSYMLHIANNSFKWHILFPRQVIFWPLIPQTLGHFTPYYIKTSDQTKISQRENSLQPKTHTASQKVGSDNFSQEGGYDWDRWQLGSAKTDLDSNSQWFISVLSPPSHLTAHLYLIISFSNCKSSFSNIPKESPYQQRCQVPSYSPLLILAIKLTFRIIFHPFSQKGRAVYLTK